MVQDNPPIDQVDYTTEQKLPAITVNTSPRLEEAPDFEHTFNQFPKLEAVSPEQHNELEQQLTPQQRIDNAFEITPKKRLVDQNNPTEWGITEAIRDHGGGSQQLESDLGDSIQQGSNRAPGKELYAEPIAAKPTTRDDLVDQNQSDLGKMIHDLRVKFMGDPEKWSTKEEVGNFINQAMSVMGGGVGATRVYANRPTGASFKINQNIDAIKTMLSEGKSFNDIAAEMGTTRQTLTTVLKKAGIEPTPVEGKLNAEGIQKIKDLVAEGKTVKEIAQELNVVPNSIYVKIRELGIKAPGLESIKIPNEGTFTERLSSKVATTLPNKTNLAVSDYPHMQREFLKALDKGIVSREGLAGELQISPYQVSRLADKFGLDFRMPVGKAKLTSSEEVPVNRNWTPERDKELLKHINNGLSYSEAGALLGLTRGQVAGRHSRIR